MRRNLLIGAVAALLIAAAAYTAWEWRWASRGGGTAAAPQGATPTAPGPQASGAIAPSFDVVRINPQGEAVIAGRAAPGAEVTVLDGDRELGRVTADRNGAWVLVPKDALPPGDHQLSLAARKPGEDAPRRSEGVVAMVVPERSKPSEPVAVLLPDQGPARALQLPHGSKLTLDIIEYDSAGKVQMLGRAQPKAQVKIAVDGRAAGQSTADADGAWSAVLDGSVPPGRHRLQLEADLAGAASVQKLALSFDRVSPPDGYKAVDVQPGNSLWHIAQRSFGEGLRYTEIYQANRTKIRDPDLIYPGQTFAVPASQ